MQCALQLDVEPQRLLLHELRLSDNVVLLLRLQSLLFVLLSPLFELLLVLSAVRLLLLSLLYLLPQHVRVLLTLPLGTAINREPVQSAPSAAAAGCPSR